MGDGRDDAQETVPADVEALRTTREEARAILDHKLRLVAEIHDETIRTVRTTVVVLGVLVSGVGIAGPTAGVPAGYWPVRLGAFGVGCLGCAILLGIVTTTDSNVRLGPDQTFREEARRERYAESEWLVMLLAGYDEWIGTVDEVIAGNETRLLVIRSLFATGFLAVVAAVGLSVMGP